MTKDEYKLQRLIGDIELLDPRSQQIVNQCAAYVRQLIDDAGEYKRLVFLALALVGAEQMIERDKPNE